MNNQTLIFFVAEFLKEQGIECNAYPNRLNHFNQSHDDQKWHIHIHMLNEHHYIDIDDKNHIVYSKFGEVEGIYDLADPCSFQQLSEQLWGLLN